jgi:hypothetical protein
MPRNRVLRAAMEQWISTCCDNVVASQVADQLLRLGIRPPTLTLTEISELEQLPPGTAVVVGDLIKGGRLGQILDGAILFAGAIDPYPYGSDTLPPPLPCTVVWVPIEGRDHFARIFARRTADQLGLDRKALLAEFSQEDPQ